MARQIFLNIAVKDLDQSVAFFTKLGFTFNPDFTNEKATCMIISENIFVMLLVEEFFQTFTKKEIVDSTKSTEAIIAISADSKAEVDTMIRTAISAGGKPSNPTVDHGFMYISSFQDIDGHLWEVCYLDPDAPENKG